MDVLKNLPKIKSCSITSMYGFEIEKFSEDIKPQYSFLMDLEKYGNFYLNNERVVKPENKDLLIVDDVGNMEPLKKRHTRNSFWKLFRLTFEIEKRGNINLYELFSLLPLKISFQSTKIKICNHIFPAKYTIYLFPFGICCADLNIKIKNQLLTFDEFINIVMNIDRSQLYDKKMTFERIVRNSLEGLIKKVCFSNKQINMFSKHKMIFLTETEKKLIIDGDDTKIPTYREHKIGIASIMNLSLATQAFKMEQINDFVSSNKRIKGVDYEEEIKLFNPKVTFIYPSQKWIKLLKQQEKHVNGFEHTLNCVEDNYRSILSVLFTSKNFIKQLKSEKFSIPHDKPTPLDCINKILPQINDKDYAYKKHIEYISRTIGLTEALQAINTK